ncbi:hypothetical protein Tco_0214926 [Tanacetum coccineum]
MSSITAQQTKLDLELVPKENRLDIGKCNGRIPRGFSPREPTFQVTLDALALTPCYPAFLITADVPEVYMHQFWNCIYKHDDFYRFKIDKKKRFKLTLEVFRDILQICPRVQGRDFDPLPSEEDTVSFLSLSGKTTGLDKLRLSRAQIIWGTVPPKAARKFKKASPSKKENVPIPEDEEPIKKGKRLKTAAKKSTYKPAIGIVIREPAVETKSKRKEKEKVDVAHGKGIELLSDAYPSGSGTVAEDPPSVAKITPPVTSEGTDDIPGVLDVTNNDSSENLEKEEESKDDDQEENKDDDDLELESNDETQETTQEQVVENIHVTISTITKKTKVPVTSSSRSSDLASKFLNFPDIPYTDAEIVSPLDVPVHHEVPRTQAPLFFQYKFLLSLNHHRILALEKEVSELKKDPLHTQVTSLVDEHQDTRIKEQVKDQLPQILPQEVSNLAPPVIEKLFHKTRDEVTLAKRDRKDKDKDEDLSAGSDRRLKRRKTSKDADPTTEPKKKDSTFGTSKGIKSQPRSSGKSVQSEELVIEIADFDIPHDQEGNLGDNEDEPRKETASRRPAFRLLKGTCSNYDELEYDFKECYKALSEKLDWENPEGGDYLFDLSKPLPLITHGKRQRVPFEFFINNDLMYLQGGISTMTYMTSTTKTKAAQYDLHGIEDMVLNIWSPVKVAYDKYALWGISHWREQRNSFYAFVRGMKSRGDVYSKKHILAVTHVSVMRKYGYEYLEEIVVRRADNVLYRFKEGDDVADFAIALRMYTRLFKSESKIFNLELRVIKRRSTRNRLMRSDKLYKFSDGTLTRLLSSLEDITKNIDMTFYTSAGNPVKEILLKLNLPDHRSILTNSKVTPTNHGRMTKLYSSHRFIANCFNASYLKMEVKVHDSS